MTKLLRLFLVFAGFTVLAGCSSLSSLLQSPVGQLVAQLDASDVVETCATAETVSYIEVYTKELNEKWTEPGDRLQIIARCGGPQPQGLFSQRLPWDGVKEFVYSMLKSARAEACASSVAGRVLLGVKDANDIQFAGYFVCAGETTA